MTTTADLVDLAFDADALGQYLKHDTSFGPDEPEDPDAPSGPKPSPDIVFVVPA